ncbi:MAG: hypothetical protein IJE23_07795 [Tyzzerella sp.]|nr:hypothetical protein [Tyzzerella sp.]
MAYKGEEMSTENDTVKKERTCFIITPIGNPKSEIFRKATGVIESVIRPILKSYGFSEVKAAHEICEVGSISNQVINRIIDSDLVIANLTSNNPNVMYELCLRHVVAKPIIHICEKGTDLPFDIKDNRTIFYDDDMLGASELKEELEKFVKEIEYDKTYNDNPIYNAQKMGLLLKDLSDDKGNDEMRLLQAILSNIDGLKNSIEHTNKTANYTSYILDSQYTNERSPKRYTFSNWFNDQKEQSDDKNDGDDIVII